MKDLVLIGALLVTMPLARADVFSFGCITGNAVASCNIGEAQLTVEVLQGPAANQVVFYFNNAGPAAAVISEVYFDDGTLLGISNPNFNNIGTVNFTGGSASPGDLPGGNNADPDFQTTAGFLADAQNPEPTNGVGAGERLGILFNLINGKTFADTIAAISGPIGSGDDLRIGIHVKSFANGQSESFINDPPNPPQEAPEPSSMILFGTMGGGVLYLLRKRQAV